ncbi:MAG: hypothetical protein L0H12_03940 [Nitrosospira sp.]|nr:hypothetical protein [Nitrosospira sp.]
MVVAPAHKVKTLTQYGTVSHWVESNIIFRWTIEPGRKLFVIFSHNVGILTNTDTAGGIRQHGNRLLVKLSWTYQP